MTPIIAELAAMSTDAERAAAADLEAIWTEVVAEYERRGYDRNWGARAMTLAQYERALSRTANVQIIRYLDALMHEDS